MSDEREATEEVLRQVEVVTGKPVLVMAEPSLPVLATIRPAGALAPAHLLRYSPSAQASVDYLTCFQCGFLLRSAEADAAARFEVGPTFHGRKQVEHLMREHGRKPGRSPMPKDVRDGLRDRMYDGLILQLRSVPLGLRVDQWLLAEFPSLASKQQAITQRQLRENLATFSPEIRRFAPDKVFEANGAMNAAYAGFWGRAWSDPSQSSPYRAAALAGQGEALLDVWDATPSDPSHDRVLIEGWAAHLSIGDWFEFTSPPD